MIFAAGVGSRLKPFTDYHPKALVEVGGKLMLQRVIERMKSIGIRDIVINIHHFGDQIVDFVKKNDNFGLNVQFSDETDQLLDTGGGLLKAQSLLGSDDDILIHNADILSDLDLNKLVETHKKSAPLATLSIAERDSSRKLFFDEENRLIGWKNFNSGETKPSGFEPLPWNRCFAFSGIQVVSPEIFPLLAKFSESEGIVFSITPFYLSVCREHTVIGDAMQPGERWFDVGRPASLASARTSFEE